MATSIKLSTETFTEGANLSGGQATALRTAIGAEASGTAAAAVAALDGELAAVAKSGAYADLSSLPTLGTAAAQNVEAFAAAGHTHARQVQITAFHPGAPAADALLYRGKLMLACTLPGNAAGSGGTATAAATGSTVATIRRNGTGIGTATWAAAGTEPTFATTSGAAQAFAAGDVLEIQMPATADATLAGPSVTLVFNLD